MRRFDPIDSLAQMRHEFGEHGGVNMSIETSTTFTVLDAETMPEIFHGHRGPDEGGCYLYGRHFNPTVYVLGRQIAALEGAEGGYCSASGLSAISSTLLQLCDSGDEIVAASAVYGGTYALLEQFLPKKACITTTFVDVTDLAAVEAAITPKTRVLYVESISNPTLRVANLPALADLARSRGLQLVVDNTFSPLVLSPIMHGADVVVHSLTKYINGASDAVAGSICGSTDFVQSLMGLHEGSLMLLGPTMDPRVAYAISMRLPHLPLRMKEHSRRALEFAKRLEQSGSRVIYPGLESHPDHERLDALKNDDYGFGGLFCVDMGTKKAAYELMQRLQNDSQFGYMAVSLGYADTLMSCPASSTSSEMTDDHLERAGISPGLVRISVGITGSLEQRWQQLDSALLATSAAL